MVGINPTISIITLNANHLNTNWNTQTGRVDKKIKTQLSVVHKNSTDRLKVKWKKLYHATTANQKKAGITILISERADIRARKSYQE